MLSWEGDVMSDRTQERLVRFGAGRVVLHLVAMARDGRLLWHLRGISREFSI
jgi:hypothetical protein